MKTTIKTLMMTTAVCMFATGAHADYNKSMKHKGETYKSGRVDAGPMDEVTYQARTIPSRDVTRLSSRDVSRLQRSLADQGFYNGAVDGQWGPMTTNAIQAYQRSRNMEVNGELSTHDLMDLGVRIDERAYFGDKSRMEKRGDYSEADMRHDRSDAKWRQQQRRYNDRDINVDARYDVDADVDSRGNVDVDATRLNR